jgi:hypothetical protein
MHAREEEESERRRCIERELEKIQKPTERN